MKNTIKKDNKNLVFFDARLDCQRDIDVCSMKSDEFSSFVINRYESLNEKGLYIYIEPSLVSTIEKLCFLLHSDKTLKRIEANIDKNSIHSLAFKSNESTTKDFFSTFFSFENSLIVEKNNGFTCILSAYAFFEGEQVLMDIIFNHKIDKLFH